MKLLEIVSFQELCPITTCFQDTQLEDLLLTFPYQFRRKNRNYNSILCKCFRNQKRRDEINSLNSACGKISSFRSDNSLLIRFISTFLLCNFFLCHIRILINMFQLNISMIPRVTLKGCTVLSKCFYTSSIMMVVEKKYSWSPQYETPACSSCFAANDARLCSRLHFRHF